MTYPTAYYNVAVHPRVGGECLWESVSGTALDGSSPRGRGMLRLDILPPVVERFIPAWAGNAPWE